ncbi:MAG: lipoyl synthase [Armatimonadota bacterium]|nr:lipoyl synthase [bacterium]
MERPDWIKAKAPQGDNYEDVKRLVESAHLHTVCQSANCPNIGECWHARTATFMILGNTCTRNCRFCAVNHGKPEPADEDEPRRVAEAVKLLGLRHAVITSVTRDDLADGGAHIFAALINMIHESVTDCSVEVLIPDFQGDENALKMVLDSRPEILNHNVETVERCYASVRPQAVYARSIELIRRAKQVAPMIRTKSGIMVGAGEQWDEIIQTMHDLRDAGCNILTVGQYLAPSSNHLPISRYYTPEEFSEIKRIGLDMGFGYVESGPLVRSSYHADQQIS